MGAADLADLALVAQFGQTSERLLGRRVRIGTVELEVVDVVGAQARQARLEATTDLRRVAAALAVGEAHRVSPLGGDHRLGPPARQRLAEELLGPAAPVALGGVEVGDSGVECRVDHRLRPVRVESHPEVVAAEAHDRHLQADRAGGTPSEQTIEI